MSVLLEALKKAALEKQRRDRTAMGESLNQEVKGLHQEIEGLNQEVGRPDAEKQAEAGLNAVQTEHLDNAEESLQSINKNQPRYELDDLNKDSDFGPVDNEFTLDVDFESLEEFDNSEDKEDLDIAPKNDEKLHSDEKETIGNTELKPSTLTLVQTDKILSEAGEVKERKLDEDNSNKSTPDISPVDQTNTIVENEILEQAVDNKSNADKKDENVSQPNNVEESSKEEKITKESIATQPSSADVKKEAFATLLEKNRQVARKKKRTFIAVYITLAILSAALVVVYYFYILSQSASSLMGQIVPSSSYRPALESLDQFDSEAPKNEKLNDTANLQEGEASDTRNIDENNTNVNTSSAVKIREELNISENKKAVPKKILPLNNKSIKVQDKSKKSTVEVSKAEIKPVTYSLTEIILRAYKSYSQGDFETAKIDYQSALLRDANNRDAILGLAAVAIAQQRFDDALTLYQQRLQRDPKDDYAHAGILSIASTRQSSPKLMSQVNNLLKDFPDAAHLHFLKGALFSLESQWNAAQTSFFNAWSRDPSRGDYAFNLAVSLDHLGERSAALRFYRRALSSDFASASNLDTSSIQRRISQLETIND